MLLLLMSLLSIPEVVLCPFANLFQYKNTEANRYGLYECKMSLFFIY